MKRLITEPVALRALDLWAQGFERKFGLSSSMEHDPLHDCSELPIRAYHRGAGVFVRRVMNDNMTRLFFHVNVDDASVKIDLVVRYKLDRRGVE